MKTMETNKTYAWMAEVPSGSLSIHTDVSFKNSKKVSSSLAKYGTGWTVDFDGQLVGFGTSHFVDYAQKSSSIAELRAMLFSLDILKSWHPDVLKNRHISIHCDNLMLIQMLNRATGKEEFELTDAWLQRVIQVYGKDFMRISDYIADLDLSFHWVKGHADNIFNNVADTLARRSFKEAKSAVQWSDKERKAWVHSTVANRVPKANRLISFPRVAVTALAGVETIQFKVPSHVRPKAPSKDFAIRQQVESKGFAEGVPMIWIGTYSRFMEDKRVSSVVYTGADSTIKGSRVIVTNDKGAEKNYLELRALRFALKDYAKSEFQDNGKPVVVRLPSPEVVSYLSKMMIGLDPQVPAEDHRTKHELKLLKPMLDEVKIFAFPTKAIKPSARGKVIAAKAELPQRRAVKKSAKDVLIELFPEFDFSQS